MSAVLHSISGVSLQDYSIVLQRHKYYKYTQFVYKYTKQILEHMSTITHKQIKYLWNI